MKRNIRRRAFGLVVALFALSGCSHSPAVSNVPPEKAQYEEGMKRLQSGDVPGASSAFDTAIRLNRGYVPAYLALARMDADAGNATGAVGRLQTLREISPQTPHLACRIAEINVASGSWLRGMDSAQVAVKEEPDCPIAQTQFGLALTAAGENQAAVGALKRAHELDPGSERIMLALAETLARDGRADEAWRLLDALPATPAHPTEAEYLHGWLTAEYGRAGKRDDVAGVASMNRVLAQSPDDGPANLEMGRISLRHHDTMGAIAHLERAQTALPPNVELLNALAQARRASNDPKAAQAEKAARVFARFAAARRLARQHYLADPTQRENVLALARIEGEAGNTPDAQILLQRLLQRDPNDAEALRLLTPQSSNAPGSSR